MRTKDWLKKILCAFVLIAFGLLAACSDGGGGGDGDTDTTTRTVGSLLLAVLAPLDGTAVLADGSSTYSLQVLVRDKDGVGLDGVTVSFTATGQGGQVVISPSTGDSSTGGVLTVTVTDISATADAVNIQAKVGNVVSNILNLAFTGNGVGLVTLGAEETDGKLADGTESYQVTALVEDLTGQPMEGVEVVFTKAGHNGLVVISPPKATTGSDGTVRVTVTDISNDDDTVNIGATARGVNAQQLILLTFTGTGSGSGGNNILTVTPDAAVLANGATAATITVTLTDENLTPISGSQIGLETTGSAVISPPNPTATNALGQAVFSVTNTVGEIVTLTASGGSAQEATAQQTFLAVVAQIIVDSTNPDPATAPASGLATIQVTFQVLNGAAAPVADQSVQFAAIGHGGGGPQVFPSPGVTDVQGKVTVSVTDVTAETVTVSATASNETGTKNVTFTALPPANIVLNSTSPSPPVVSISGVGAQESATLTFDVVDQIGNPVQGSHLVNFSILAGGLNGGEELTILSASTVSGLVSTVLNSGITAGTIQVRASLDADPTIYADVSVTITGGLPHGPSFGLSFSPLNIFGRSVDNLTQGVSAWATDYFSNPVAPNVQVQFQTDYAGISGSDVFETVNGASEAGATITSKQPHPDGNGFVTVQAQTIGGLHAKVLSLVFGRNDSTLYAGTDGGGVFKTTDGGSNWSNVGKPLYEAGTQKRANLLGSIVYDLDIDASQAQDVVYAATDKGVFVSLDGGQTWRTLSGLRTITETVGTIAAGFYDITYGTGDYFALSYQNSGPRSRIEVLVGGTSVTNYVLEGNGIRFFGTAGGAFPYTGAVTVTYDTFSDLSLPVYALAVDHTTYDAGLGHATTVYAGLYGDGVWRTVDGGKTWSKKSDVSAPGVNFGSKILSLAFNSAADELLAGTEETGLFMTSNASGACTWTKLAGMNDVVQDIAFVVAGANIGSIWVAGGSGIHYSTDAGATWQEPTTGVNPAGDPLNVDVRAIVRDPNDGTLYVATYGDILDASAPHGGIYRSSDGGDTWTKLVDVAPVAGGASGAHFMDALAIRGVAGANDVLAAGSKGRTVALSIDGGTTWTYVIGTATSNLTNRNFASARVMHTRVPTGVDIRIIPLTASYQPMNDYTDLPGPGYGSFGNIYWGETHGFYVRVADDLGNRLPAGTTVTISLETTDIGSIETGNLGGTLGGTLGDGTYGATDYYVYWTNNHTQSSAQNARMVVTVEGGDDADGTDFTEIRYINRSLIAALSVANVELTVPATVGASATGTITPTGGSTVGYDFIPDGPIAGGAFIALGSFQGRYTYTYPAGGPDAGTVQTDSVVVLDKATGYWTRVTITITITAP